jgi:homocysteine S-methyltransferase
VKPFLEAIAERVLVCDGATGTMLYAKGIFLNRCFDELNLTQPDLVAEVHQDYVRAGADVIETNTFGANRVKLGTFALADRVHAINLQGARIARHAARDAVYVAGSIGPLGIRIEPWGKTGVAEAEQYFAEQAAALVEGGVDLFVLETFRDVREMGAAIAAVRAVSGLPIVAQMTTREDGTTVDGVPPEIFAPEIERLGATLIGVNCSVGPADMLETIERIARSTSAMLSAQPNAGSPREIEGRNIYLSSPDYMASYARRFILNRVKLVGGCCGTTPEHIRAIKGAVRASVAVAAPPRAGGDVIVPLMEAPPLRPVPRAMKSRLANTIARGGFVVTVEMTPPRGDRSDELKTHARLLKVHGVDAITIPDDLRSGPGRMSAWAAAVLVEQQTGLETVLQYSCRERNLQRMQSDLLGAHALGLRNVAIVTGPPTPVGDYAGAVSVLDVDSIGLTNVVGQLNRGLDLGGQRLAEPTGFHVGVQVNPSALDQDEEIRRFEYKVQAGAEFAVTPPVFDLRGFDGFLARIEAYRIPIIAGILPFESVRQAEFLANEVPGTIVPDALLDRMRRTTSSGEALDEGLRIARELAGALRPRVEGLQITIGSGEFAPALTLVELLSATIEVRTSDGASFEGEKSALRLERDGI